MARTRRDENVASTRTDENIARGGLVNAPDPITTLTRGLRPIQALLATEDLKLVVTALLSDEPPQITAGYGGWEAVARPGRRAITAWRGTDAPTLSLPLLLDGLRTNHSVEPACRALERMAGGLVPGDPEPPKLIVAGAGVPHSASRGWKKDRWVISELAWNAVIKRRNGDRVRQQVDVTLFLFTEAKQLRKVRPRKPAPRFQVTVAKEGDTYEKIAARVLTSKRLGRKLAKLNGDRDPTKKLKKGRKVRLPSAHLAAEWVKEL